jgi:DNA polymerase-1
LLGLPVRRRSKPTEGSLRAKHKLPGSPAVGLKAIAAALVYDVPEGDWRRPVLDSYHNLCKNQQLQSLYFNKLPLWRHPRDGKVHPYLRNCGTVTRRPSGASPNFLQVAKGPIRTLILPGKYEGDEEERVIVSIDLANQELVILGYESGDPTMLDAFMSSPRKDLHSLTSTGFAHKRLPALGVPVHSKLAYEAFMAGRKSQDKPVAEAYNKVRNKFAKACNFLIAYGGGYTKLAENLLISENEAKELIDSTFALYPGVKVWQNNTADFAKEHGYVKMAYGTRRHATTELWSEDNGKVKRQERQLCNAVIQSGAAEILKVIRQRMVDRDIVGRYRARMLLPIYDEMTASVPLSLAKDYIMEMADIMRVTPPGKPVGMEVEASVGWTWGSQIEIGIPSEEKVIKALEELNNGQAD